MSWGGDPTVLPFFILLCTFDSHYHSTRTNHLWMEKVGQWSRKKIEITVCCSTIALA